MLEELKEAVINGVLTSLQYSIVEARAKGATYDCLLETFQLSGKSALVHAILRTVQGRLWYHGHPGGQDPYLSDIDQRIFVQTVNQCSSDLNCITTPTATAMAHFLVVKRFKKAVQLLLFLHCPKLLAHLEEVEFPSKSWLADFCTAIGLKLCRAESLEHVRRLFCNETTIQRFFANFGPLLQRSPLLIFNMDETSIASQITYAVRQKSLVK
jgi:hypothetical protein